MDHHRSLNLSSPLLLRNQTEDHTVEAPVISCGKEIQDITISKQVMLTILWDSQGPVLET
jgi:hypothetical protein